MREGEPTQSPIHPSIKERLDYAADDPDGDVLRDWKARLRRVCKPCWELKYCPYGPLVEQSPLLPTERSSAVEHNEYVKRALKNNQIGELKKLDEESRRLYEQWLQDDEVLAWQALYEMRNEIRDAKIAAADNPGEVLEDLIHGELPPIHEYRVPFEVVPTNIDFASLSAEQKKLLKKKIRERKRALAVALRTDVEDNRKPLDNARRALFVKQVRRFCADDHPERVPEIFRDGECNIFGHICPVFFAAEAITETSTERRHGRYIPFPVKMRVVRRDNHTCQHCGKHLADDEVEFDHKIPISKGGSSEEHNVRLTCYECNRDKKDNIEI